MIRLILTNRAKIELPNDKAFDYISAGLVDSLSLLRFVIELEDAFKVTFTDAEVASPEFRTVGGLVALLERKISA